MSALGSSEARAPQRLKCISIVGSSNGATQLSTLGAVSSLGRVRFRRFHCIFYRNSLHFPELEIIVKSGSYLSSSTFRE